MYIRSVLCLGSDTREIRHYYPTRRSGKGSGGRERSKEEIQRDNDRKRARYVRHLISLNFQPGDWHLVLRYPKGRHPKTYEEAQERLGYFLTMMRTVYKAAGLPFKYIAVTERGKRGNNLHHHLIIEDIDQDGADGIRTTKLVKQIWPGTSGWFDLYEEGGFQELADYLVKKESKEELGKGKSSYSASRNLIRPRAIKHPVFKRTWDREPKAPKGWYVIKQTVLNATIKETGQPYQRYTIKRAQKPKPPEGKKGLFKRFIGKIAEKWRKRPERMKKWKRESQ